MAWGFDDDNDTWVIGISTGDRSVYKMSTAEIPEGRGWPKDTSTLMGIKRVTSITMRMGTSSVTTYHARMEGVWHDSYLTWRSDHREDATQTTVCPRWELR